MALQIKTYSGFSKKFNSTKRPTGGITKTVELKNETNIKSPTFILNTLDLNINYVEAFGNYYYCDVKNLDGHRCELVCTMDRPATFKGPIGSYTGLIDYCSGSSDLTITDPRNQPTLEMSTTHSIFNWVSGKSLSATAGTFVLCYLSDQSNSTGLTKYAAMDWYALSQLSYELFTQNIADEIKKQFTNMTDSLVSLAWMPIDYNSISGSVTSTLTIGSQPVTLSDSQAKIINDRVYEIETSTLILTFPYAEYGSDIRNTYFAKAPYLTSMLYLPYIGNVPVSDDMLAYYNSGIYIKGSVDVLTGDVVYGLYINSERVSMFNGSLATHLPISSASYDAFGSVGGLLTSVGGAIGAVGAAATGNIPALMGSAGVALGGAASAVAKSSTIHTQINGTNSSAIGQTLGTIPRFIHILNKPVVTNPLAYKNVHGMPYFKVDTVANCGGYVQCHDASVSIPGDGEEQTTINAMMNAGFYYE